MMIGRLHHRLTCSSSSRLMRQWKPSSAAINVACASSLLSRSKITAIVHPPQQPLCHNNARWLATKRQKRAAAAAAAVAHGSGSSNNDENTNPKASVAGCDSTKSATAADLPRADDATGNDDDDKTLDDGRIFQSHDQIFAKRDDATAAASAPQQSPTLWLPPPLTNTTKDLQEAFQQQHDSSGSLDGSNKFLFSSSTSSTSTSTSLFEFQDHYRQIYNPNIHLASAPTDWTGSGYEPATPLWHDLAALIGVSGRPISVADYMRLCLSHPIHGYYTRANNSSSRRSNRSAGGSSSSSNEDKLDDFDYDEWDDKKINDTSDDDGLIIGPSGDFVTAPEMTQIFGECIAVWFMTVWQQKQQQQRRQHQHQKSTTSFGANDLDSTSSNNDNNTTAGDEDSAWQWLEFGPGTGTLMADLIRFCFYGSDKIRNTFGGSNCRAIHFIEQSPRLRKVQKKTLESVHKNHAIIGPGEEKAKQRFVEFEFHDDSDNNHSKKKKDDAALQEVNDNDIVRLPVYWHDSLAHFHAWQEKNQSHLPTHAVCQEYLDALPIYAFEKTAKEGWRERLVDIALRDDMMESIMDDESSVKEDNNSISKNQQSHHQQSHDTTATVARISAMKKPRLRIVLAPEVTPAARTLLGVQEIKDGNNDSMIALLPNEGDPPAPVGSVIEVNPEAILLVQDLARLIDRQGGAAFIIDYGPEHGSRDSIRAFSRHKQVHFLSQPGLVDITADVDFAALKHAVNHMHDSSATSDGNSDKKSATTTTRAFGPVPQGNFLMAMGANDRAVQLIENDNTTEEEAENVYQALLRLCSPEEMGQRFKVMALLDPPTFENSNNDNSFQHPPGF